MTEPKQEPKKEYTPPKVVHELDLETKAGSPLDKPPKPPFPPSNPWEE